MMTSITAILASGPARQALGLLFSTLTIALFILNLRRAGERVSRLTERLSRSEKTHAIQRQMLDAATLMIAMLWLSACGMGSSDRHGQVCPSVVVYSAADQARAAEEIEPLPVGSVVVRMLSDYAVLRDQARTCH
jgi:hypothetical protein